MDNINLIYETYHFPEIEKGIEENEYNHRCKYLKLYSRLIERCQSMTDEELSGYNEEHHILPKSMGGTNCEENRIIIPVRYHIMAHIVLLEAYPNCYKLIYATRLMIFGADNTKQKIRLGVIKEKFSSRTVALMREKVKMDGEKNPFFGKKHTEESRRKISESNKGKKRTKEQKERISKALKRREVTWTVSEETRRKRSEDFKGEKNPNYGKHPSEETRKKMSEAKLGKPGNRLGSHPSEETKRKISNSLKKENNPNYGKQFSEETRKKMSESRRGKKISEETREKLRIAWTKKERFPGRSRKVVGPDGTIYNSITEAAKVLNISGARLSQKLHDGSCDPGWSFYKEDNN